MKTLAYTFIMLCVVDMSSLLQNRLGTNARMIRRIRLLCEDCSGYVYSMTVRSSASFGCAHRHCSIPVIPYLQNMQPLYSATSVVAALDRLKALESLTSYQADHLSIHELVTPGWNTVLENGLVILFSDNWLSMNQYVHGIR